MKPCGPGCCMRQGCPGFAAAQETAAADREISEFAGPSQEEELQRQARAVAPPDETEVQNGTMKTLRDEAVRSGTLHAAGLSGFRCGAGNCGCRQGDFGDCGAEQRRRAATAGASRRPPKVTEAQNRTMKKLRDEAVRSGTLHAAGLSGFRCGAGSCGRCRRDFRAGGQGKQSCNGRREPSPA
jgi:hypothetical protein